MISFNLSSGQFLIVSGENEKPRTSLFELALATTTLAAYAQSRTAHAYCTPEDPNAARDERWLAGEATADPESFIIVDVATMV